MELEMHISRRRFIQGVLAAGTAAAALPMTYGTALAETGDSPLEDAGSVKRVRTCCRACGKMECGVWVTVENGRAVKVEGDNSALTSAGNCCTKSQASILACYHPARLYHPLKRTNPKDYADPGWVRISWDEAIGTAAQKFLEIKEKYGGEALFGMGGTSRVWSMGAYGSIRQLLDTPNMIVPWQVCKGPRHFATGMQSAFAFSWQALVDRPETVVRWGAATEISNYDDSCRTTVDAADLSKLHINVDPRLSGLSKEADYWMNLRPGTDAALALSWCNVIIENDLIDDLFVKKWTNAPYLVCEDMDPSGFECSKFISGTYEMKTRLLKESDLVEGGNPKRFMVWDNLGDRLSYYDVEANAWEGQTWTKPTKGVQASQEHLFPGVAQGWVPDPTGFDADAGFETEIDPALYGEFEVTLKDGRSVVVKPVWEYFVDRTAEYEPVKAEVITGIPAQRIKDAAIAYATRNHPELGYGNGGISYMLAVEHQCNSIQNCRILDILCAITGNWDTPGGMRGPTASFFTQYNFAQTAYGIPELSEKQFLKMAGAKEFPLLNWWQWWADATAVYEQMESHDPYPIVGGICQSGDFMNMGNSTYNWEQFTGLDFFLVLDLWHTPLSGKADILLPCQHWIEVNSPRPSQGSSGGVGANVMCVEPPADTKYDPEIIMMLYKAMGVPYGTEENRWPSVHDLLDRAYEPGNITWDEFVKDFEEHGWWDVKARFPDSWGTYRRYEMGGLRSEARVETGATISVDGVQGFSQNTGKIEIWSTIMETWYPEESDIIPDYREPPLSHAVAPELEGEYPLICNTGRRIPVYFHSEHRQLPWCRELWPVPRVEIHPDDAAKYGIEQGDWVWIESQNGKVRQVADIYAGIQPGNINCEHQWWYPELEQSGRGFELSGVNCLVSRDERDRHCGSSYLRAYPVKIYKATPENSPFGNPVPCGIDGTEIIHDSHDQRLREWMPDYDIREEA